MTRIAVVVLVAASGSVEAISFTALDHVFAGVMTSNLALLGLAIGRAHEADVAAALLALAGFGVMCERPRITPSTTKSEHPHSGGATLHYSHGNTTDSHRRASILNYRSAAMIQRERDNGMDHGLTTNERTVRSTDATS
jgi:hypothetical protein